jgi:hypothetical protein
MKRNVFVRPSLVGVLAVALVAAVALAACGSNPGNSGPRGADGGGAVGAGSSGDGGTATTIGFGDAGIAPGGSNYSCPGCPAFPAATASQCASSQLAPATIAYPLDGLLLPPNMNVLEVQFVPPQGATLFEVDFENAVTDVRVETQCQQVTDVRGGPSRGCGVTLSQAAWNDIANKNRDGDPLRVFVRATDTGQACVSTSTAQVDLSFAKDDLVGAIYYWQSATYGGIGGKTGGIFTHDFGTFDPTPTPFYTSGGTGTCVGCHTLSLDGARMSLMTDDPDGDDEFGDVNTHILAVATRTVLSSQNLSPGFQTWTHDHAKMIASTFKGTSNGPGAGMGGMPGGGMPGGGMPEAGMPGGGMPGSTTTTPDTSFAVYDGNSTSLLGTLGLPSGMEATQPNLSTDDATLVFVVPASGTIAPSGDTHFKLGALWTGGVDFTNLALDSPTEILGATTENYYYPAFSPDKSFIVFDDAPDVADTATTNGDDFYNRNARVKVLHYPPAAGAQPIDLPNLNVADGLTNSWPRWSPFPTTFHGHSVYWVTFSSNRNYGLHLVNSGFDNCYPPEGPSYDQPQPLSKQDVTYVNCAEPQIWMAAVIVDADPSLDAQDRSFPAFWLPFQDVTAHNHSAQWVEQIQAPPVVDAGTPTGDAGYGGTCGEPTSVCSASALCCSDAVCCGGECQYVCTIQ